MPRGNCRGRIELTLATPDAIVSGERSLWSSIRSGLATSISGLMWSLQIIIVGLCFVVPWVLILWAHRTCSSDHVTRRWHPCSTFKCNRRDAETQRTTRENEKENSNFFFFFSASVSASPRLCGCICLTGGQSTGPMLPSVIGSGACPTWAARNLDRIEPRCPSPRRTAHTVRFS